MLHKKFYLVAGARLDQRLLLRKRTVKVPKTSSAELPVFLNSSGKNAGHESDTRHALYRRRCADSSARSNLKKSAPQCDSLLGVTSYQQRTHEASCALKSGGSTAMCLAIGALRNRLMPESIGDTVPSANHWTPRPFQIPRFLFAGGGLSQLQVHERQH